MPFTFPSPMSGYTLKRTEPWATFQGEIGTNTRYVLSKAIRVKTSVAWNLDATQQAAFDAWFLDDAESGNQEITLPLAIGKGGLSSVTARLDGAHTMLALRSASTVRWNLSAPIEFEIPTFGWGAAATTTPLWSATGLPIPEMASWNRAVSPSLIRTSSSGPTFTRLRRRAYYPAEKNPFSMRLDDAEFAALLTFFENTLHAGSDWFTMNLLRGSTLTPETVRFASPWSATALPGCRWKVDTELEVRSV